MSTCFVSFFPVSAPLPTSSSFFMYYIYMYIIYIRRIQQLHKSVYIYAQANGFSAAAEANSHQQLYKLTPPADEEEFFFNYFYFYFIFFRRFFIFARETPRVYFYLFFFSFSFDDDFDDWQYKIRLAIIPVFIRLLCSNSVTIPLTCLFFHHLIVFFLFFVFFFFIFVPKKLFLFYLFSHAFYSFSTRTTKPQCKLRHCRNSFSNVK